LREVADTDKVGSDTWLDISFSLAGIRMLGSRNRGTRLAGNGRGVIGIRDPIKTRSRDKGNRGSKGDR
jgi:hypothetical protein